MAGKIISQPKTFLVHLSFIRTLCLRLVFEHLLTAGMVVITVFTVIRVSFTLCFITNIFYNILTNCLGDFCLLGDNLHTAVLDILCGADLLQNVLVDLLLLVGADGGRDVVVGGEVAEGRPDLRAHPCQGKHKHVDDHLKMEFWLLCFI